MPYPALSVADLLGRGRRGFEAVECSTNLARDLHIEIVVRQRHFVVLELPGGHTGLPGELVEIEAKREPAIVIALRLALQWSGHCLILDLGLPPCRLGWVCNTGLRRCSSVSVV